MATIVVVKCYLQSLGATSSCVTRERSGGEHWCKGIAEGFDPYREPWSEGKVAAGAGTLPVV